MLTNNALQRLTEDFERVTGIDCGVGNQVRVKNDQEIFYKMKTTIWKRFCRGKSVPIPRVRERWSEFIKANNVEVGDTCVFYYAVCWKLWIFGLTSLLEIIGKIKTLKTKQPNTRFSLSSFLLFQYTTSWLHFREAQNPKKTNTTHQKFKIFHLLQINSISP